MPGAIIWLFVAGVGAAVGSFLNVCIHRLPLRLSIVRPGSSCPACGHAIVWRDNIPIVSYLLLRGRCRHCRFRIPPRYPIVEATTAALFVLLFHKSGPTPEFVLEAALASALVALIAIDARHLILPDAITLPGIALGLLSSPLRGAAAGVSVREAIVGCALGYALPWSLNASYRGWQAIRGVPRERREDGIGRGDFKLLAMIGAFLGWRLLLFTLFFGAVTGAVWGVGLILFGGRGWKSRLPYGVFLGGAAILAVFFGDPWLRWYAGLAGPGP